MRRRMLASIGGAKLPYKRRLAYLESTGTQWIDTGVFGDRDTEVYASFMITNWAKSSPSAQVAGSIGGNNGFGLQASGGKGLFLSRMDGVTVQDRPKASLNEWTEASMSKRGVVQNGVTYGFGGTVSTFVTPTTMRLFMSANSTVIGSMRISRFDVSKNGEFVRKYIPVMSFDDTPEIFDEVTQTFAERHGDFLYGELE